MVLRLFNVRMHERQAYPSWDPAWSFSPKYVPAPTIRLLHQPSHSPLTLTLTLNLTLFS